MRIAAIIRFSAVIALSAAAILFGNAPAAADKRVALIIGNGKYVNAPALKNPKNDAEDVAAALRALDFEVVVGTDLDRAGMNEVLDQFSHAADGADIAFVYYSGHGMQLNGANWLLPVETRLESVADVNRFRLLPLQDVLETLRPVRGARVVVLDACRNNPVEEELKRRLASLPGAKRDALLTRGLGKVTVSGLLVAYATQADDVAADGIGRNSPFTAAFVKNVNVPDIDVRTMFFRVQDEVDQVTNGRQRPELSISLVGEYKLKITITAVKPGDAPPQAAQGPTIDPAERAWNAVLHSSSIAIIEEFLKEFGDSFYARYARVRLEELKKSQGAAAMPATAPPTTTTQPTPAPDPAERAWTATKESTSIAALEDFVRQFGSSPYGSLARARIEVLKKSQVAVITAPGKRVSVSDGDKSRHGNASAPISLCVGGTLQTEKSTRPKDSSLDGICTDPDYIIRNLERDNSKIYWTVGFTDGEINCTCTAR